MLDEEKSGLLVDNWVIVALCEGKSIILKF